ncbi:CYTH domain-containing protein [Halalkalibacter alkalisediminis]|uniref:CYTH domain-containing protein n=1 Tax=Halalkalibacter alkalisediminis TaxID=935616 RepID=A0ABV6NA46_9BACI|nr:CYTH domain-containing protein [Halalkalibacter alkalisediminis]
MSQEVEIEVKSMLTENNYYKLLKGFNLKETDAIVQHNHYFETSAFSLKEKKSGLRIREIAKTYTLTLKQPLKVGKLETHQPLSAVEWELAREKGKLPDGEVMKQLIQLEILVDQLEYQGTLTTSRIEIEYEGGILCFDKSSYFDQIDYELEYEGKTEEHAQATLSKILSKYELSPFPTENKVKRFFNSKLHRQNGN